MSELSTDLEQRFSHYSYDVIFGMGFLCKNIIVAAGIEVHTSLPFYPIVATIMLRRFSFKQSLVKTNNHALFDWPISIKVEKANRKATRYTC